MDYFKKKKIRDYLKRNKGLLIGSGAFLLVGATALIVGMYVSGWDFLKWIKTGYGLTTLIFIIAGAFVLTMLFLLKKNIDTTDR